MSTRPLTAVLRMHPAASSIGSPVFRFKPLHIHWVPRGRVLGFRVYLGLRVPRGTPVLRNPDVAIFDRYLMDMGSS